MLSLSVNNKLIFLATRPPYHVHVDITSNLQRRETNKKKAAFEFNPTLDKSLKISEQKNSVMRQDTKHSFKNKKQYDEEIRKMKMSLLRSLGSKYPSTHKQSSDRRRNRRSVEVNGMDYNYESSNDGQYTVEETDNSRQNIISDRYNTRRVHRPNNLNQYQSQNRIYGNDQSKLQNGFDRIYERTSQNEELDHNLGKLDDPMVRVERLVDTEMGSDISNMRNEFGPLPPDNGMFEMQNKPEASQNNIFRPLNTNSRPMLSHPAQPGPGMQQLGPECNN
ncbi:hypothetical protein TNCV_2778381 [Trichonephila clavipes]|nr:hypothetical protein TNCV_2778381 [Trichonephila clavipes]